MARGIEEHEVELSEWRAQQERDRERAQERERPPEGAVPPEAQAQEHQRYDEWGTQQDDQLEGKWNKPRRT